VSLPDSTLRADGTTGDVFVKRWGNGPRLYVGLHGWNGSHLTFQPLVPHMPDDVTMLAVDLPGYGKSAPPREWTGPAIASQIAESLVPHLDGPVTVVGNCSGTALGAFLARRLEDDLQAFYLLEPFAFVPWYLRLLLTPLAGPLFYRSAFGTRTGRAIASYFLADQQNEETDMMAPFADNPIDVPYQYLALFDRLDPPPTFEDLDGDKYIVEAADNFRAVEKSVAIWQEVWPAANLIQLEAGHLVIEEATADVAENLFRQPEQPIHDA
jgi:pimeloyl-ACP methyl ester carboxylesterase